MSKIIVLLTIVFLGKVGQAQSIQEMAIEANNKAKPHYPSLSNAHIKTRITHTGSAISASYTWWSIVRKPSKRQYFVNINDNVKTKFICFQFNLLSPASRTGVYGHELAHLAYFHSLTFWGFLQFILHQALPNGIKQSERTTDYNTIKHGLGKELKQWSGETRQKFIDSNPKRQTIPPKFAERYLTPIEIDSVMLLFADLY